MQRATVSKGQSREEINIRGGKVNGLELIEPLEGLLPDSLEGGRPSNRGDMVVTILDVKGKFLKVKLCSRSYFNVIYNPKRTAHTKSRPRESSISKRQTIMNRMTYVIPLQLLQKNACEKIHDN